MTSSESGELATGSVRAQKYKYERRRPEASVLYQVIRDHLETLYAAVEVGFSGAPLPGFVRAELEGYLTCGLLCRGLALLRCEDCPERRIVAFSCKGRGFCPSCLGRRMSETTLNLLEHILPRQVPLRQWVLTLPYALRYRLAYDGKLLGAVSRLFVDSVLGWYGRRFETEGVQGGVSGAVTVLQRCSSDLKLNPHLHVVLLDGVYAPGADGVLTFHPLSRLSTSEVADVLQVARVRILRYLERRGVIEVATELTVLDDDLAEREPALAQLSRAAVSGLEPAGPELRRRPAAIALPNRPGVELTGPLCVQEQGFNLHAATRAGAQDESGREARLLYVLRPPVASERIQAGPDGLVRIALKRPFSDGTFALDLDPLSLLCRLCTSVPAPRLHTVRYAGVLVLGSHSKYRSLIVPSSAADAPVLADGAAESHTGQAGAGVDGVELAGAADAPAPHARYRPWAQLLRATFAIDVEICPACQGRRRLVALVTAPHSVARLLTHLGEPTEPPLRAAARGPPYFANQVVRRKSQEHSPQLQLFDE